MTKLHELLAVEGDLAVQAKKTLKEGKELFGNPKQFLGTRRVYEPLDEYGEKFPDEVTHYATTVNDELENIFNAWGRWVDTSVTKEVTNCETSADVYVDGKILFHNLPATALLNLENKLSEILSVLKAVPTNDPNERWTLNEQDGVWVSEPRQTFKTEKIPDTIVGYDATPEHPAQVQYYNRDIRIGTWTTTVQSGMVQPTKKRTLVANTLKLLEAVKKARQRANDIDTVKTDLSEALRDFIWE